MPLYSSCAVYKLTYTKMFIFDFVVNFCSRMCDEFSYQIDLNALENKFNLLPLITRLSFWAIITLKMSVCSLFVCVVVSVLSIFSL